MKIRPGIIAVLSLFGLALTLVATGFVIRVPDAGSEEANVTRLTARLLEESQFSHHRLDDDLASKFLDRYLDALDGDHLLFLQSDVDHLAAFRPQIAELTRKEGDAGPAHAIFSRYLERLRQRTSYVTNLLHTETFHFSGHDQYGLDREHAPRPASLAEARALWRQRVRFEFLQEKLADKQPAEIVRTLTRRYARFGQTMERLSRNAVLEIYLDALAHVYDPHSDYLGHEQMESLSTAMNLSLFGVGATLQSEDGYCKIHDLIPGGPAARSGLVKPGDRIVAVAQEGQPPEDVVDLPLPQAVELIRGPKGTAVRLTLIPAGADDSTRKTITLVRDEIKLEDQRAKARVVDLPQGSGGTLRVGVIDLPSFYASMGGGKGKAHESATKDVARLLRKLKAQHIRGVILDLRHNGGGSLDEAITLTGLFIRKGPVVQTRDPSGSIDVGKDEDGTVAYDGPLVVLTSRFSASASEILAGALKDYGRALIVGDASTFGKGTVQQIVPLEPIFDRNGFSHPSDPGALKVTIRKFYRPDGASTQLHGVRADLVLPSLTDQADIAESAMQDPLPWDSVHPARYEALNRVRPYLASLRARSAARLRADPGLAWLREDEAELRKKSDAKVVSLNEAERRREKLQAEAQAKARKRELLALHETPRPSYEITAKTSAPAKPPPAPGAVKPTTAKVAGAAANPGNDDSSLAENIELREAENILADYIDLSANSVVVTRR